ncbi:phosphoribosyltransferase [Halarcobacter anaerophilus]|jgi:putative phosphoribosyl transferase|uniref:ABC transporter n=1 Tax=Halarcobacter anaerophilus TaxID=877500 RepID=A0A4Q0Y0W1_9BACT|nr:phosphoribosyltransferase family protein [Halarcobacter anaerophilus]QDF29055.1 putative phosphoribosyltransferase [Halarcobacter anaerophilus]RXJ63686.1 ABC transporter [Halarcobacter anaerophilus]
MTPDKIYFKNREVAAYRLIDILPINKMKLEDWIVISTSYNGLPIAKIVANELDAKLDIIFSRKIYAPNNDECEIAIVTESEEVVIHEELVKAFDISLDFVFSKSKYIYENELSACVTKFRKGKKLENLENKNVLLVDEGLNTSLTMMACIKTAIHLGAKSVSVAIPILPTASIPTIESIADDLYFVKNLDHFISIDFYYDQLEEISYEEIKNYKG